MTTATLERMLANTDTNDSTRSGLARREAERFTTPATNVYETDAGMTLELDLPGVAKEGLEVSVDDGTLTITGRPRASNDDPGTPVYREFVASAFRREFRLGRNLDAQGIRAALRHGVLTLEIPKAERAKRRTIDVTVGR